MSDNGGLSVHGRGGEPNTHNKPLASGKGSLYEGGIREPMLVKWPGKVAPNSVSDHPVIIEDFYPTLLDIAQVGPVATVQKIDGRSFLPVLEGGMDADAAERPLVWHYPNRWGPTGPGIATASAVRLGDWKLVYYHEDRHMELFNLREDIGETRNRVDENPEKVRELAGVLGDYLRTVNAQMPIDKETRTVVPYPDEVWE